MVEKKVNRKTSGRPVQSNNKIPSSQRALGRKRDWKKVWQRWLRSGRR